MDEQSRAAWDTPVEETLAQYLGAIAGREDRDAIEAHLRAALRAEPIARGCPSLAMLTALDLLGLRAHLELHGTDADAALAAVEEFLTWARVAGAHSLPAALVTLSLYPPVRD